MKEKKIILGVTGSIAAYKGAEITRRLREEGMSVLVIMTKEAQEFITALTLETLSGNKVYKEMFGEREYSDIEHISLAEQADLILIAPATANIIAKIAAGICDDLLTATVCATKAKVLITPAMNENMYLNKITQENIRKLKALGYKFVEPKKGRLACGKIGLGCLAEIETIIKEALKLIKLRN
ncbi:MAG: bifunctional phosphopantothenoylcysteine decarboxylase/phosphopantothenate--cysteine ligase CoaBC [Candidatus Omnitrophota bacterium]